jgi:hypothetical protein
MKSWMASLQESNIVPKMSSQGTESEAETNWMWREPKRDEMLCSHENFNWYKVHVGRELSSTTPGYQGYFNLLVVQKNRRLESKTSHSVCDAQMASRQFGEALAQVSRICPQRAAEEMLIQTLCKKNYVAFHLKAVLPLQ